VWCIVPNNGRKQIVFPPLASSGSSTYYTEVATYADLPDPSLNVGKIFLVQQTTGIPFVNRKLAGLYRSDGTTWVYLGDVSTYVDLGTEQTVTGLKHFENIRVPAASDPLSPVNKEQVEMMLMSFEYLLINWSVAPSLVADITNGSVYQYTLNSITRYRFVPTEYDPTQDAFYLNFDGTTLTNLIIRRG
jgi:hypothetical protein